jgi:signal peptidase I
VQDGEKSLLIAGAAPVLLTEVLKRFGQVRLRVSGTSMLPAIRPGDILVVHRCAIEDVDSSDVILFGVGERLFVHRVIRKHVSSGAAVLITKGDALRSHDPAVSSSQVLGRVAAVERRTPVLRDRIRYSRIGSACGMATHGCRAVLGRLRHRR